MSCEVAGAWDQFAVVTQGQMGLPKTVLWIEAPWHVLYGAKVPWPLSRQ